MDTTLTNLWFLFSTPGFGEIAIVSVCIFLTVLLLGLLIGSKWHWIIKSCATLLSGAIFALTYFSIIGMQGWPTTEFMPAQFEFLHYYADVPNPVIGKEGFLVVWMLYDTNEIGKKPRSFLMPYDKELHKKLLEAKKRKAGGARIRGKISPNKKGTAKFKPDSTYEDLNFYNMPPPNPPRKD